MCFSDLTALSWQEARWGYRPTGRFAQPEDQARGAGQSRAENESAITSAEYPVVAQDATKMCVGSCSFPIRVEPIDCPLRLATTIYRESPLTPKSRAPYAGLVRERSEYSQVDTV